MLICKHRVNTIVQLDLTPSEFGVEVDIRSDGKKLYLDHEAFGRGENFEDWLARYNHKFLILNVKEEGLEDRLSEILASKDISNWAFLDQSFPFLIKGLRKNETRTMVRVSEYENVDIALNLSPKPDWVWLDSFTGKYPSSEEILALSNAKFKFMIVSPELQGRAAELEIKFIKQLFKSTQVLIDGVCTKVPSLWS